MRLDLDLNIAGCCKTQDSDSRALNKYPGSAYVLLTMMLEEFHQQYSQSALYAFLEFSCNIFLRIVTIVTGSIVDIDGKILSERHFACKFSMAYKEKIRENNKRLLNVHGFLQQLSEEKLGQINSANKLNYSVAVLNLFGDLNIGMIMRTAAVYSAKKFVIFGRKKMDARSCVGSNNYIDVIHIPNSFEDSEKESICPEIFRNVMEEHNFIPIFVEQNGKNILDVNWKVVENAIPDGKEICFIFGNEGTGISAPILQSHKLFIGSEIISIPQTGIMRSLNVSSAAAIVLWEFVKCKL